MVKEIMSTATTTTTTATGGSNKNNNIITSSSSSNYNNNSGSGPCGACKFLRRKCVKGCIFAPYFDSEQGAGHFAAVHKVFGASNVSKLLLRIPAHKRLDAVVTICYEALARIKDPVYGCVAHIFALQQQVVNLQSELAFVQAHLSTLELSSSQSLLLPAQSPDPPTLPPSSLNMNSIAYCSTGATHYSIPFHQQHTTDTVNCCGGDGITNAGDDLLELAKDFVAKHLSGVRCRPSTSC